MDLMPTQRISRRTLAALAGSLFIVLCYWFYPHSHTSGVKKYVDNDWTRYDEVSSSQPKMTSGVGVLLYLGYTRSPIATVCDLVCMAR
jgi:hypothetical protein